jgi:hypothetical protein
MPSGESLGQKSGCSLRQRRPRQRASSIGASSVCAVSSDSRARRVGSASDRQTCASGPCSLRSAVSAAESGQLGVNQLSRALRRRFVVGCDGLDERPQPSLARDDEEHVDRRPLAGVHLGVPVQRQLVGETREGFRAAVPLEVALDRPRSGFEEETAVGDRSRVQRRVREPGGGAAAAPPLAHTQRPVSQCGRDQARHKMVRLQPVQQLRMRSPVVTTLPAKLLTLQAERRGYESRTRGPRMGSPGKAPRLRGWPARR